MNFRHTLFVPALLVASQSVFAANMNCSGGIIEDNLIDPVTKGQVVDKCGQPDKKEGNVWVYHKGNLIYRLQFDSDGSLRELDGRLNE